MLGLVLSMDMLLRLQWWRDCVSVVGVAAAAWLWLQRRGCGGGGAVAAVAAAVRLQLRRCGGGSDVAGRRTHARHARTLSSMLRTSPNASLALRSSQHSQAS